MNPETAELAIAEAPSQAALPTAQSAPVRGWRARAAARAARVGAARESWRALWISHAIAWGAGIVAVLAFGFGPTRTALNPRGLTRGLGALGNVLAAPVARWDSAWYLVIAHYGYRPDLAPYTSARTAYFPVFPLTIRAVSWLGAPLVLAGVLVSFAAFGLALYGIHRLTSLELASGTQRLSSHLAEVPRLAVIVMAFSPMAFFFSAIYSESLFLAFSVGLFWSARQGRWALAGLCGALAAATRSTGLMLIVPALLLYFYGPREDRPPDRSPAPPREDGAGAVDGRPARGAGATRRGEGARRLIAAIVPHYRLRRELLWLALLPAGVALYAAWLGLSGGDPLGPFHAEQAWERHLVGPIVGVWDGLKAGFDGARQLLSFQRRHVYFPLAAGNPFVVASHNLLNLAFLLAAVAAFVGVIRRLPLAYGAYALAAIALPLSYPVTPQPLMSIPRYLIVLFPLSIWLAAWLAERPRLQRPAFALSVAAMAFFAAQFATWHWVA
ncbi:MAG TPA: mannosyltransferase family protein [Solirubrobacteraceae bacterium]|nr:mannosyltransferase family protein [Solirubrobacteraceae bacterium]